MQSIETSLSGHTYAEPLAGLRVSWGSILAGSLATLASALLVWALSLALILSASSPSIGALRGSVVALAACAIGSTLLGAFVGGAVAGYLPGNRGRRIAGLHGILAWALAFVLVTVAQYGMFSQLARTTVRAVASTASTAVSAAGAAVGGAAGGQGKLEQRAAGLLEALGYPATEAKQMVESAQGDVQHLLRGRTEPPVQGAQVRGALDTLIGWAARFSWAWFFTWTIAAGIALFGSLFGARLLARPERMVGATRARASGPGLEPTPAG